MEKFIPYEKLSKKKRRELDRLRRGSWGGLDPVTRRSENPKAYNRRKARKWDDGSRFVPSDVFGVYSSSANGFRSTRTERVISREKAESYFLRQKAFIHSSYSAPVLPLPSAERSSVSSSR